MAHIEPDFKTKKAAKEAIAAGRVVMAYQPGGMFPLTPRINTKGQRVVVIEAPAEYHKWYAEAVVDEEFRVLSLK